MNTEIQDNLLTKWPTDKLFAVNISALREQNNSLAEKLQAQHIPNSVQLQISRDGSPNYRIEEQGKTRWLGYSWLPLISAKANCGNVDIGSENIALNEIGHGADIKFLLKKMQNHQALLVIENNLLKIALAFRLHDFSIELQQGRLILISDKNAQAGIVEFYNCHNGYALIQQTITRPYLSEQQNRRFAEMITAAIEQVANNSALKMQNLLENARLNYSYNPVRLQYAKCYASF